MPHRLAQQWMTVCDLEWPFHASRATSVADELLVLPIHHKSSTLAVVSKLTSTSIFNLYPSPELVVTPTVTETKKLNAVPIKSFDVSIEARVNSSLHELSAHMLVVGYLYFLPGWQLPS